MIQKDDSDYKEDEIKLARFAKALAHPARIKILKLLAERKTCFCGDIVDDSYLSQSTVSQHLKELKEAGLIQGEINPPKIKYCINRENWLEASKYFDFLFK